MSSIVVKYAVLAMLYELTRYRHHFAVANLILHELDASRDMVALLH